MWWGGWSKEDAILYIPYLPSDGRKQLLREILICCWKQKQTHPNSIHIKSIRKKRLITQIYSPPNFPSIRVMHKQIQIIFEKRNRKWHKEKQGTFLCISLTRVGNAPTQQHQIISWTHGETHNFQIAFHRKPLFPKDVDTEGEADESWHRSVAKRYPELTYILPRA